MVAFPVDGISILRNKAWQLGILSMSERLKKQQDDIAEVN